MVSESNQTNSSQKCVNCGKEATVEHHLIPRSEEGKGTVPLCEACHNLIHRKHYYQKVSASELIKRGQDKIRVWKLLAVREGLEEEINLPKSQIKSLCERLDEIEEDPEYAERLFLQCGQLSVKEYIKIINKGIEQGWTCEEILKEKDRIVVEKMKKEGIEPLFPLDEADQTAESIK